MKHEYNGIHAPECLKIQQLQLVYISLSRFLIYKNRQVHTFLNRSATCICFMLMLCFCLFFCSYSNYLPRNPPPQKKGEVRSLSTHIGLNVRLKITVRKDENLTDVRHGLSTEVLFSRPFIKQTIELESQASIFSLCATFCEPEIAATDWATPLKPRCNLRVAQVHHYTT